MSVTKHQHSVLLERVFSMIGEKVGNDDAELIKAFGKLFYKNISFDDLDGRNDSDLYGATLSLWQMLQGTTSQQSSIKVFNPDIAKHGWQSSHTIIQIIVQDMPFLVDSVRMVLNRLGISAHLLLHMPIHSVRSADNSVQAFVDSQSKSDNVVSQTVFLIEIDRQSKNKDLDVLKTELHAVVDEVSLSVADWQLMRDKLSTITQDFAKADCPAGDHAKNQAKTFLNWLNDHNFTLMGYRHYAVKPITGDHRWIPNNDTSLGLMKNSISDRERLISRLPASARDEALGSNPLILTKTNSRSKVHRPAYMDYVGIKEFDQNGQVVGEHRFIGLYSASFYNSSATDLPMLREKIERMCDLAGFEAGTHAYKAFVNIVETYPRDELLQTSDAELANIILGIFQMQERGISRLFVRKDVFGRFYSCLVYVPRERYNTALRKETQALLKRSFASEHDVEFNTYFSESVYARTHYIARVSDNNMEFDVNEIEDNLIELTKTWQDKLASRITSAHGEAKGKALVKKYADAFSRSYMEENLPSAALVDLERIDMLTPDNDLDMLFYRPQEETQASQIVKLKLYHRDVPIHLSDVLPVLENFGLRVIDKARVTHWQKLIH
mgnify:CR=1 FL=1